MFFVKVRLALPFILSFLFSQPCPGQNPYPTDPPIPVDRFKQLSFEPPAPDILAVLKIPFLAGEKYGLVDADGKILLEPQFEEIAWMEQDLPVFWANKNGKWAFFDLNGKPALPFSADQKWAVALLHERKGFRFDERGNHIQMVIPKIKDPRPATYTDPGGKSQATSRYYFIKPKTKPPYRAWFLPDHVYFIRQNRDRWVPSIFTSEYQHENLKVMDENGRFGLLDRDGNLLQTPVRNCATIGSPEKILILDENNRIALRDAKRGWQTEFLFNNVETTPELGLFLGEWYESGQPTRLYAIDSAGHVSPIEGLTKMEWLEKTPKTSKKPGPYQFLRDSSWVVLSDLRTGKELFRIEKGEIGHVGMGLFQVQKDKKYGWLDSTGRLLLPVEFTQLVGIWQDRRLIGIKNGLHGLFDAETGEALLPVAFPYLARHGRTFGRGVGFHIRSGQDWIYATKDLEIVGQKGPNAPIQKTAFVLPKELPAAAHQDFEKAVLPEIFTSAIAITGPNWVHFFRCDGPHIISIETGPATAEPVFFSRTEYYLDEGNSFYTGFARVQPAWPAKPFYVRMQDGKVFKK